MSKHSFVGVPNVKFNRAQFNLSHSVETSCKIGKLYPLPPREVLPGDTWVDDTVSLTRLASTLYRPIIGDIFLDVYHFFVPLRILQTDAEEIFGATSINAWESDELTEAAHNPNTTTCTAGTVADYLGVCPGTVPAGLSVMPFRAFARVWNEWFRSECDPILVNVQDGDFNASESLNNNAWSSTNYTGQLPPVTRYKDYFSSALLKPQKGPEFHIAEGQDGGMPVRYAEPEDGRAFQHYGPGQFGRAPYFTDANGDPIYSGDGGSLGVGGSDGTVPSKLVYIGGSEWASGDPGIYMQGAFVQAPSVNEFRTLMQLQKMVERDALYGTRYKEYLLGHYGVSGGDSRMQIPEFLSGSHTRLNIQQVQSTAQTVNSGEVTPLAQLGAYSQTISQKKAHFAKSFTEHGYIISCFCIRFKHTYSQGFDRLWMRNKRNDFYDPLFATLGAQAVYKNEVAPYGLRLKEDILGYQEAWAEYRSLPNRVTGGMRPSSGSLGEVWSLADKFASQPGLLDLIYEDDTAFKRCISVPDGEQFIVDFFFNTSCTRVLPSYSVPGLVDHH